MTSLLSLRHVSKRYPDGRRDIRVLDDVSLEVDEGEFVGVWGMRGSGKTTLLEVASGRVEPDEGEVWFDGRCLTGLSADARARLQRHNGIGLLYSEWRADRNAPAIEHVALPLLSDGMSLKEAQGPAWRTLERVGAAAYAHMPSGRLSRHERFRVGLAQALVGEPRVLLIDEPAGLSSPSEEASLFELLRSLGREDGIGVVIASEEVVAIRKAQRMMTIDAGKLRSNEERGTLVQFPERRPDKQHSRQ